MQSADIKLHGAYPWLCSSAYIQAMHNNPQVSIVSTDYLINTKCDITVTLSKRDTVTLGKHDVTVTPGYK